MGTQRTTLPLTDGSWVVMYAAREWTVGPTWKMNQHICWVCIYNNIYMPACLYFKLMFLCLLPWVLFVVFACVGVLRPSLNHVCLKQLRIDNFEKLAPGLFNIVLLTNKYIYIYIIYMFCWLFWTNTLPHHPPLGGGGWGGRGRVFFKLVWKHTTVVKRFWKDPELVCL